VNGFTKALASIFVIILALGAIGGFAVLRFITHAPSKSNETVVFEVKPGESFKVIARHLEEQNLVTSGWKLQGYARLTGFIAKIRVGEYALARDLGPRQVLSILASGRSIEYSITVPEGANRFEIAELVEDKKIASKADFLEITSNQQFIQDVLGKTVPSLEGYLFPETYHITKYTGAKGLIKMMVGRFKENYDHLKTMPDWNVVGLSDQQLVTLASIVEKETGAPEERPVIASVFHNRLRIKMPLQTDPTIIYGIWEATGAWNHNISKADLQKPGPWNSYLNQGLPPGPISNPGLEALKAAGQPAKSEYLFFVSRNNGTHVFSRNYNQHLKAVGEFQLDRAAREGKSWRDLQKRAEVPTQVYEAPLTPAQKKSASPQ
jgi:UPF0755 protein